MANDYRDFIDFMAHLAQSSATVTRLRQHGHAERANERDFALNEAETRRKTVVLSMSKEQREVLAELLRDERIGAVHDVVANLDAFDVRLNGQTLLEQADEEPKFDIMDRIEGRPWRV